MSGGGGSDPTISTYYVGVHFVLGHGPFDEVTQIQVAEKEAWAGSNTGGTISVNAPELFGGNIREGGIVGKVDIAMGLPGQAANSYLTSVQGTIPAHRGVVSAILKHVYVGTNYYLKNWFFRASRIHKRKNGAAQWQDSYAELAATTSGTLLPGSLITLGYTGSSSNVVMDRPHGLLPGQLVTVTGVIGVNAALYNGTFIVAQPGWTATNLSYVMTGTPTADATGTISIFAGAPTSSGKLINAVHVVRECLTDTTWGLGISEGLIDEASFLAAAQTTFNEGLGFSWYWDKDGSIQDFIEEVLKHIQGSLYLDRQDGLFHLSLVRFIEDTSGLITLNSTNTREVTDFKRASVGSLTSEVTVKFIDNATDKENSVTVIDASLAQRQGYPISKIINYTGVANVDVAHKLALRDLQQLSTPIFSCSISCNRIVENLNIGDAFILDWPDYLSDPIVMRILTMSLGTATKQGITIEAVEDIFYAATTAYYTPPASGWVDPVTYPIPMQLKLLNEAPYYMIATQEGDQFAQDVATTTSYIISSGPAPTGDSIAASIWSTTGSTFTKRRGLDFCFSGLLQSDITKTTTSIVVTSPIDLVLLTENHFIQIDNELLGVTAIVGNTLTVIRGVLDTVPEVHLANARMYGWQDFSDSDEIEYLLGEVAKVKLTTITPKGELDVSLALEDTITIMGRMHRPYPPGNVKVDGAYWPTSVVYGTGLTVTWVSRNRFQQTTGLIDYYTGAITTEPGVTYSGELLRVDTLAVLDSFSGISVFTKTFITGYLGDVRVRLWSVNANGVSVQVVTHDFTLT